MYLAENLRVLRKRATFSQAEAAEKIGIPRTTLGDYERGHTEPAMELLTRISKFYSVSIDDLLNLKLEKLEWSNQKMQNTKVLTVSVDLHQRGYIELVKTKVAAGYIGSFHDPEFISELPKILIPTLQGHFRAFEIEGDSMYPMESGSIVICKYIEQINDIRNNTPYVVVSKREGLVYKRLIKNPDNHTLLCKSDNSLFVSFQLPYDEIKELWEYHAHIGFRDPKIVYDILMEEKIGDMQKKVTELHRHYIGKQLQD
jgi:transcriptional regulator with XRE-family HTH domain